VIHRPGSLDGADLDRLAVRVRAPARLHLGFVDVSGSLGRRFGSIGLALDDFSTDVELRRSDGIAAQGESADRALDYLRRLIDQYDVASGCTVAVRRAIPEHVGLGSGTQLALAVGAAFGALLDVPVTLPALAALADRGARSGVGIGAFEHGGFIVDGGRGSGGGHPPVIARLDFPPAWRVLLVFDRGGRGLSGEAELAAFRTLNAFPQASAARLAHLVLLRLLPALTEQDCGGFGEAVGEIQRTVGDYFAAAQGGRFASPAVAEVLAWLEASGVAGVGQSSWGPTGFGVVDSELRAHALLIEARSRFAHRTELELVVARGRNRGHETERLIEAPAKAEGKRRHQS
jgi:beta-ribofuranosylaminobenzene 5'-phosphate synthase